MQRAAALGIVGTFLIVFGCGGAAAAGGPTNIERCLAIAAPMDLGAALPHTRTKLRASQPLTIVALGSSSTSGFGGFGRSFPAAMKGELSRRHPSLRITVINSGRVFATLGVDLARIDKAVLHYRPDLVVWQIGTNEVLWRGIASGAAMSLRNGVRQLKQAGIDVILMDLQDSPAVRAKHSRIEMETMIGDIAREEGVGLFPRYLIMQRARAAGVKGLVFWDGLHNSAAGYRCIGIALARMIDAGVAD